MYPFLAVVAAWAAGSSFLEDRRPIPVYPAPGLTKTGRLSDYLPSLADTRGDADVYYFRGALPGGVMLVLGGMHPNEPGGNVAATVLLENLQVQQGEVIVIPQTNASGFTATEPQEGYPPRFRIVNRQGKERFFKVGSRFTNILDGWPDPIVYRHYPSGQLLSGNETRNLNRAYPGRRSGTLTERMAWAVTELVRREKVDLVVDMHEAAPEYPVINAMVAHERAMDLAAAAVVELGMRGVNISLEASPSNLHGLTHRELGDHTPTMAVLLESAGALQGRIRGPTDTSLVVFSRDPMYTAAGRLGKLKVDFPKEGIPLEVRVGRHLEAVKVLAQLLGEFDPERAVVCQGIPGFSEITRRGVGYYLR